MASRAGRPQVLDDLQVYSAATKKDQATILWQTAATMVRKTPGLLRRFEVICSTSRILVQGDFEAVLRPLSKEDGETGDGLRVYMGAVDELHAHKTPEIYDVLDSGMGARDEPLLWAITTAGADRHGVCWREREYLRNLLEGTYEDDSYFGVIHTIDEDDDPFDPAVWPKANPNLIGAPHVRGGDYLEEQARQAREQPARLSNYLRKHCNVWVGAENPWITLEAWEKCGDAFDLAELKGRECFAGLDLARVRDLSAFVLVFPSEDEPWYVIPRFWCPEDNIRDRAERDRVPYDVWADERHIETTPGNTTDFKFITQAIIDAASEYDLREVAYDRVFAGEIVNELMEEGITMVPFGQGWPSMAAPVDETERMIISQELAHDGNPVMSWMAGNAVVKEDPVGNRKLDKDKSRERIDGMVALVMAIGRASVHMDEGPSQYETGEGVFFI